MQKLLFLVITGRLKTVLFYCVLRSAVISQTILLRQVGVVLGPLSIFGIQKLNFTLPGGRQVNQYNALGFCLTFLWLLVFILVFALYHDKGKSHKFTDFFISRLVSQQLKQGLYNIYCHIYQEYYDLSWGYYIFDLWMVGHFYSTRT